MNNLQVIEVKGQRVLTTKQLAENYGTTEKIISNNFNNNTNKYIEGKHFYCLTGDELKDFKRKSLNLGIAQNVNKFYLWTERGTLLHAKSLNTDKAWQVYDYLIEHYFRTRQEQLKLQIPFPEIVKSIEVVANSLKVNNASKLLMYDKLYSSYGVSTEFLPKYEDNKSREIRPATELLKRIGSDIKIIAFNQLLIKHGYLEERTRKSTKSNELKYFKALTEKGLKYGENLINQKNQREVQPYYYADTFQELYNLVTMEVGALV